MLLSEAEPRTELMILAEEDGVTTVEEYSIWLNGYMTALHRCMDDAMKIVKSEEEK